MRTTTTRTHEILNKLNASHSEIDEAIASARDTSTEAILENYNYRKIKPLILELGAGLITEVTIDAERKAGIFLWENSHPTILMHFLEGIRYFVADPCHIETMPSDTTVVRTGQDGEFFGACVDTGEVAISSEPFTMKIGREDLWGQCSHYDLHNPWNGFLTKRLAA